MCPVHALSFWALFIYLFIHLLNILRRNLPEIRVTSGQKSSTKIIYIELQTSVGLF